MTANYDYATLSRNGFLGIIGSGPRCGVYTLIHWDHKKPAVVEAGTDDLRKASVCVRSDRGHFVLAGKPFEGTALILDPPRRRR